MEVSKKELAFAVQIIGTTAHQVSQREESLFQSYQARVLSGPSSCTDVLSKTSAHVPVSPLPYLAWTFCSVPVMVLSASRVAPPISITPRLSLLPLAVQVTVAYRPED